uniref:Uncharacterized protein n=1 Tax=Rhipicephalus microplus TaxID=6941 RepID=A0A6G5AHZ2_RHIMP
MCTVQWLSEMRCTWNTPNNMQQQHINESAGGDMPVFVVAAIELSFFCMLGTARNQLRHIDSTPSFYTGPNVCFVSSGYCKYAFSLTMSILFVLCLVKMLEGNNMM